MIHIKYTKEDESIISVTPMPSNGGLFGDETLPNCPAEDCCLIQSAKALRSQGLSVSIPQVTEEQKESAVESILLLSRDSWDDEFKGTIEDAEKRIDSIKGYTQEDVDKYILDNTVYDTEDDTVIVSQPTTEEAVDKLINKVDSINSPVMTSTPVTVPTIEEALETLKDEWELSYAERKVEELISTGFLVPVLEDDWKAQFEVTELV